ncbi:hypothetical protein [Mycobacterium sp. SMC-4]|uniref:hypothetical protein n=1 Tax=Mycobacterium sp. SMC-4 TaxID=2857059 RepID=UPI0021B222EB|nr:hypothetical protein [Mycobacterium sp. SMC-4]UXA18054.1 hypothetical protein KXD98_25875 [Mycobacterium sp. SMC-4]
MNGFSASSPERRCVIVAALIAFCTLVVSAEWALATASPAAAHSHHALATNSVGLPAALLVDHAHVSRGDHHRGTEAFAEAVVPRSAFALIALVLLAVVAAPPALWRQAALAAIRGPPRHISVLVAGRDLLCRLCIARR